jgi:transposase
MNKIQEELNKLSKTNLNFFHLAKIEPNPAKRIRLLALGHLKSGKTKSEVIKMFQISFPTLRQWLSRFLEVGIEGLNTGHRTGRRRKLPKKYEEAFIRDIENLQENREGGRIRGQDIQVLLKEKFSVEYALPSIYHLLERFGFSWISARSKHPNYDPFAQDDFKKNSKKK